MSKLDFEYRGLPTYYHPIHHDFRPMSYHTPCHRYPYSHLVLNMMSVPRGKERCVWCGLLAYWIRLQKSDENEAII